MLRSNGKEETRFSLARKWLTGVTAGLVVLPALINAGIDVYNALLNIPKTASERANAELFRKYFNKPPVASFPVPVKHSLRTVEVRFSIYEEGDLFIEYGSMSQWFPFPKALAGDVAGVRFIAPAVAQDAVSPKGIGRYEQSDRLDGATIVRRKSYENGVVETQRIDTRTGEIKQQSRDRPATPSVNQQIAPFGVIDLNARNPPRAPNVAQYSVCVAQAGRCAMVVPVPVGAQCSCYTTSGAVAGIAQ